MKPLYVQVMDGLYYACMAVAGVAIAVMAVIIGWSVYTRYVLTEGSFWAEPVSIALAVQMTFYGAAACYRANAHISIDIAVRGLRGHASMMASRLVDSLMLIISLAMIWYGLGLVKTTFFQVVVFGHSVEAVSKYVTKGRLVLVEGRLDVGDKNRLSVVADTVRFGPSTTSAKVTSENKSSQVELRKVS